MNAADQKTGIPSAATPTVAEVGTAKSLSPEERERVVAAIRKLQEKFPTQSALAAELGVQQQTIGAVVVRGQAPGVKLARNVAKKLRISLEELLTGIPPKTSIIESNRDLPGWTEAASEVIAKGWQRRFAVTGAGALPVSLRPDHVTAPFVLDLAKLFLEHASADQRREAETAEAKEDLERSNKRQV